MKKYLTYVAGPYSHSDPAIQEGRFIALTNAAGLLMRRKGWNVFSPITHSHPLHKYSTLPGNWEFWKKIDTEYLRLSRRLVVVTLPGWQDSVGVTAELKIARRLGVPILYLNFVDGTYKLNKTPL